MSDKANASGDALERFTKAILSECKIQYTSQYTTRDHGQFGEQIKVDIFIHEKQLHRYWDGLYIECKRQEVSGSCDEKVAYVHEKIKSHCSRPVVVVVDGSCSERIFNYLKKREGGNLKQVLRKEQVEEFIRSLHKSSGHNGYLPLISG